jgi:hypothetical protein
LTSAPEQHANKSLCHYINEPSLSSTVLIRVLEQLLFLPTFPLAWPQDPTSTTVVFYPLLCQNSFCGAEVIGSWFNNLNVGLVI